MAAILAPLSPDVDGRQRLSQRRIASLKPEGRWAVTAGAGKPVWLWSVASGRLLQVPRPPLRPGNKAPGGVPDFPVAIANP